MGSHQEPDPSSLPFGYAIDPALDPAFEIPPVGNQLLSEGESQILDKFFSDEVLKNIPFQMAAQGPLAFGEGAGGPLYATDLWFPQIVGLSAHLPNQHGDDQFHYNFEASSYAYVTPADTMASPTSPTGGNLDQPADVLAAASVLSSGPHGTNMNMPFGLSTVPTTPVASTSAAAAQMRHYSAGGYGSAERNTIPRNGNETMLNNWIFPDHSTLSTHRRPRPQPEIPQFGTDPNFSRSRYEPPSIHSTLDAIQFEQAEIMNCFKRTDSAAPTRASSPVPLSMRPPGQPSVLSPVTQTTTITMSQPQLSAAFPAPAHDEDESVPPRKKAKCKAGPTNEVEAARLPTKSKAARSGKAAAVKLGSSPPAGEPAPPPSRKRRRAGNRDSPPAKPRENLTDEQKRENHIKSEQKRRQMIAEGYSDLAKVTPGLDTGGLSKSLMLQTAGDFLERLLAGNDRLRAQLEALKAAEEASNGAGSTG
ncbi:hypothetical protein B0T14DRAFT_93529 [Immersiella caudata]|uniref:BHLH domain-containing protein n=1 Tax=Immersiella caudata TaxID=314043 RepID=A0AA39X2H9_9PEZI|nr:hypothetical protein B0T14DRAFT_93529 [Immersiella caudata]